MKDGDIGADGELDHQLSNVGGVVVVLHQALAHLAGGDADHRIGIGVIAGGAAENFDADASLLELGGVALESLFDGISEQGRIALAVGKERVNEQPVQLLANGDGVWHRVWGSVGGRGVRHGF